MPVYAFSFLLTTLIPTQWKINSLIFFLFGHYMVIRCIFTFKVIPW